MKTASAMMKRYLTLWTVVFAITFTLLQVAHARRLKVYTLPKAVAPGQLVTLVFENPNPEQQKAQSKCTAEKLIAWVKSDIPILRIDQKGKQIWTSLGSYQTMGDSAIATFMMPVSFEPGEATLYLVNDRDQSVPYHITIGAKVEAKLLGVEGNAIKPLGKFRVIGEGYVPEGFVDEKKARQELEANVGLSSMTPAQQWTAVNHRLMKDWDKLTEGNFLYLEQNGKTWRGFVHDCGITPQGMTLEFQAPPDIVAGPISLQMGIRMNGTDVFKTAPITVNVTP
jgi:hypothetical protein